MILDTSAVLAILFDEPERRSFTTAIQADPVRLMSAANVAGRELDLFLLRAEIVSVSVGSDHIEAARIAWRNFGKGRHSAGLNFGNCLAYGLAVCSGEPLLFKGEDFPRTPIRSVF
ncbi:MAG TPA: type II toxin-antitoxin system VapC family toxin [Mycobacteriales bacterium]|nr:type II toxin-antitoxin system VapC family toxin [Mycobacteriales bacterium]